MSVLYISKFEKSDKIHEMTLYMEITAEFRGGKSSTKYVNSETQKDLQRHVANTSGVLYDSVESILSDVLLVSKLWS